MRSGAAPETRKLYTGTVAKETFAWNGPSLSLLQKQGAEFPLFCAAVHGTLRAIGLLKGQEGMSP